MVRGAFRVRGDVVDVFAPYMDNLLRVELFGDETDSITEWHAFPGKVCHFNGALF